MDLGPPELGIGTGWNEQEPAAYGIELGTPRQRSDRLAEACRVLTRRPLAGSSREHRATLVSGAFGMRFSG